ncbi:restriction endonuclease [Halolamina sp.]|jgi:restriction system protein|uniref:restriction endonuclease n=1 Tax=Halolamina sp. TaxID=1940283 RepID=UPI000223BD45|nr:restriction endonuclease [halophilic archaeon DL31]
MDAATARESVLDRAHSLSPTDFELLCKVVLGATLPTATLSVTPRSRDGGIDVEGRLRTDWVAADFGVQAKRHAPDNRVGSDRVHRLGGALLEGGYHVGTLVTTASFTKPATDAAESLPIRLVDGEALATTMVQEQLGVRGETGEFTPDSPFWSGFGETEQVETGNVPLASNLARVEDTLRGMVHTDGTTDALERWLAANTTHEMDERHVRINANGCVILGLARTEPAPEGQDRYGPTELGAEFLQAIGERREQFLIERIRSVDIVQEVLRELDADAPLTVDDIDGVLHQTTGLSESSIRRRGSAVRSWLERLPEVESERRGRTTVYRRATGER